ncbi:hypothetical protein ACI65C_011065, partial [Semiaphis heraclei]
IKIFMNQISVFESSEITAFGIFTINLNLVMFMNGIVEYDQKLTSLPRFLLIHQQTPKKNYWNSLLIFTIIYYIAFTFMCVLLWPPKTIKIVVITMYFFRLDFIMDITVFFFTFFFLQQLKYKFQTLNDSWRYLVPGFLDVHGELTHSITGMTLDKIRLLHAELSDLLRLFSITFGQIILGFFVFSYIDILLKFYYCINVENLKTEKFIFSNFLRDIMFHILYLQNVIMVLGIIIAASHVHEKVKLFMNQITVFESSEITAFGIFSINLNIVISILILLVT